MNTPENINLDGWTLTADTNPKTYTKDGVEKHITNFDNYNLEEHFKNGKLHGMTVGRMHEPFMHYPNKTSRIYLIEHYKNDELSGVAQDFSDDGSRSESHYKNGVFHGNCKLWFGNGNLEKSEHYVNGKKHGKQQKWFENGLLALEEHYKMGLEEGTFLKYEPNGLLKRKKHYINGNIEGLVFERWQSGEYSETTYKNNLPNGIENTYYANKTLMRTGELVNGNREGKWLWYHENGNSSIEEHYLNDKLDGKRLLFDEKGAIEATQVYKNNECIQ